MANALEPSPSHKQVVAQVTDLGRVEADRLMQQGAKKLQAKLYRSAAQSFEAAVILYRELGDYDKALQAIDQLKKSYLHLQDVRKLRIIAIEEYAIRQFQYRDPSAGFGASFQMLSLLRGSFNPTQIERSIALLEQELTRQKERNQDFSETLSWLGLAHSWRGNSDRAISYLQQSFALDPESDTLLNLGRVYLQERDYPQAIAQLEKALRLLENKSIRESPVGSEAEILSTLATAYLELGNPTQAISYARSAKAKLEASDQSSRELEKLAKTQFVLGRALFEAGQIAEAEVTLYRAFEQMYSLITDRTLMEQSGMFTGQFGNIFLYTENLARVSSQLQQVLIAQNKVTDALKIAEQGRAVILKQDLAQKVYQSSNSVTDQNIAVSQPTPLSELSDEQLMELISPGRRRNREEVIARKRRSYEAVLARPNLDPQTRQRYERALAKLDQPLSLSQQQRARLENAVNLYRGLNAGFGSTPELNALYQQQPTIKPLSVADIQAIAREQKTTLVQYSIISDGNLELTPSYLRSPDNLARLQRPEKKILIWVVKPDGEINFRSVPFSKDQPLAKFITTSRSVLGIRGRGLIVQPRDELDPDVTSNQQQTLQNLYQLLIKPIEDLLPQDPNRHVTFIPDHSLFLVPFSALQDKTGQYLIDRHTILINSSIQAMKFTQQQRDKLSKDGFPWSGSKVLVVGNPTMPSFGNPPQQLSTLPGTAKEADSIATQFNTQALKGSSATKLAILSRMPQARLIHFATHGILDDIQELGIPGAIALAPSEVDEGWLTAAEIADLNLQAELVVLSACDTSGGVITSDGVVGLSRSFFVAGVPSVIASLWKVPDRATMLLMQNFYQNLKTQPDKAQALRQAMLTTRQTYPDPLSWSAFVLIGEAE